MMDKLLNIHAFLRYGRLAALPPLLFVHVSCSYQHQIPALSPTENPKEHKLPKNILPKNKKPDLTSPDEDKISPDYFIIALNDNKN